MAQEQAALTADEWTDVTQHLGAKDSSRDDRCTRLTEMYVVGLLWKIISPSWDSLWILYAGLSTLGCACLMLMGRRICGSAWGGLGAGLFLTLSSFERYMGAWSFRDTNPLWFWCISLGAVAVLLRSGCKPLNLGIRCLLIGVIATIGYGWRLDALLIAPALLVGCFIWIRISDRRWLPAAVAAAAMLLGITSGLTAVNALRETDRAAPSVGFHIAYYANAVRANLLGLENMSQVPRSDEIAALHATAITATDPREPPLTVKEFVGPRYGSACKSLFLSTIGPQLPHLANKLPLYIGTVTWQIADPDCANNLRDIPSSLNIAVRILTTVIVILGAILLLYTGRDLVWAWVIIALIPYYHLFVLLVLPESKHFAACLAPLSLLAGGLLHGALVIGKTIPKPQADTPRKKTNVVGFLLLIGAWSVFMLSSAIIGYYTRGALLHDIAELPSAVMPKHSPTDSAQVIRLDNYSQNDPNTSALLGFSIPIREFGDGAVITAYHEISFWGNTWAFSMTHRLQGCGERDLFITLFNRNLHRKPKHACWIEITGGSFGDGVKEMDMRTWQRGPAETVMQASATSTPSIGFLQPSCILSPAWVGA
ncbi:MAG: hypothetical protein AAB263_03385, partial [Planctomycetota bacterium]